MSLATINKNTANESETNQSLPPPSDLATKTHKGVLPGVLVILFTVGIIGGWSWLFPIEQSVALSGQVKASTDTKAIQHLEGGIIEEILVAEGQEVTQGDPLIRLQTTQPLARFDSLNNQLTELMIQHAVFKGKQQGTSTITLPSGIDVSQSVAIQLLENQQQVLDTSLANQRSQIALYDQRLSELNSLIRGLNSELETLNEQISMSQESVDNLAQLQERGHVTRTQFEQRQSQLLEYRQEAQSVETRIIEAEQKIITIEAEKLVYLETQQEEIAQQISTIQGDITRSNEELKQVEDILTRTEILAPESGVVVDMATLGTGSVVSPGEALMRILPKDDPLVIQVYVPPQNIDKVFPGQQARLMFSSYDTSAPPMIDGELSFVSEDIIQVSEKVQQYQGEVQFDATELANLEYRLRPGMQVDVFLDAGEITLLGYIVKPLVQSLNFVFVR